MNVQQKIDSRTTRLQAILAGANERITAKSGTAAADLNGIPAAIDTIPQGGGGGGTGETIEWKDITVTPEEYSVVVTAPEGFGIRSVTIPAEEDFVAENILIGADLWGLKGGHRAGTPIPKAYEFYLTEAILLCAAYYEDFIYGTYVNGGNNFFLAENDEYITIGFVPTTGMTITDYNPATTEFSSYGWVGYQYEKATEERTPQDYRLAESPGGNYAKNIKYATFYIEYNGMTLFPVGVNCYPDTVAIDYSNFDNGSFTETLETGDTLEYTVKEFDTEGRPIEITTPNGATVEVKWGES